ncbi:MAG: hypothetical protein PHV11_01230 [Candidatus Bipolaricaulis sp.]|nr:hypothetical protein [Candidatus Bipolaricaulis sp.]MDD5219174.1 hypothetical protein [Candidatus Bipolaricaulis sp.]MDD5645788.1 hypothetical protein [Candidatus Bipolaricaulis sp.]
MDRWEDGAAFPVIGKARVSKWVDEMGAAYTAGAPVLLVLTPEPRATQREAAADLDVLRLGYVQRAAELLRDRPERASVVSQIHRFFDESAEARGEPRLGVLAISVLADVLASLARARGLRVRAERALEEGVAVRLVAISSGTNEGAAPMPVRRPPLR